MSYFTTRNLMIAGALYWFFFMRSKKHELDYLGYGDGNQGIVVGEGYP